MSMIRKFFLNKNTFITTTTITKLKIFRIFILVNKFEIVNTTFICIFSIRMINTLKFKRHMKIFKRDFFFSRLETQNQTTFAIRSQICNNFQSVVNYNPNRVTKIGPIIEQTHTHAIWSVCMCVYYIRVCICALSLLVNFSRLTFGINTKTNTTRKK